MVQKLPNKSPEPLGGTGATLSDGTVTYGFLLDPQSMHWTHQAHYASNSVLDTSQPDVRWKHSDSTLSIPEVLFISQGDKADVSTKLDQLRDWTLTGVPLRFAWGSTVIARCFLTKFMPIEKQWRSGKCTHAEATLDLMVAREPVNPSATVASDPKTSKEIYTPREKQNTIKSVQDALKNPAKARKLGAKPGTTVEMSAAGLIRLINAKGEIFGTPSIADLKAQGIIP